MKGILEISWMGEADWVCAWAWAWAWDGWRWAAEEELWLLVLPSGVFVFGRSPGIFDMYPMGWYHHRLLGRHLLLSHLGPRAGTDCSRLCGRLVRGS